MEYELAEEDVLLDHSNNPSLDRRVKQAAGNRSWIKLADNRHDTHKPQKAELIPEETETA